MLKLIKANQGHLVATIIAFVIFIVIALIGASDRFNYALDYELQVLKPECNFKLYTENKTDCIKSEYQ